MKTNHADASDEVQDSRGVVPNLFKDRETSPDAMATLDLELRESEERYRTLFDLVPVAVYTCDRAGVIQNFNRRAAELWGRAPAFGDTDERFCGSNYRESVTPRYSSSAPMARGSPWS